MTESLFETPEPEPLRKPTSLATGSGPISYAKYDAKHRARCDDCVTVLYEASMAGVTSFLPARHARHRRRQGSSTLLLCTEHRQLRERDELEQAVLREIEAHRR